MALLQDARRTWLVRYKRAGGIIPWAYIEYVVRRLKFLFRHLETRITISHAAWLKLQALSLTMLLYKSSALVSGIRHDYLDAVQLIVYQVGKISYNVPSMPSKVQRAPFYTCISRRLHVSSRLYSRNRKRMVLLLLLHALS